MSFYEKIVPYYDEIFPLNQKAYQLITKSFPAKSKILDLGAGTGSMAIQLAKEKFQVTAVEPDAKMVQSIQQKRSQLQVDCQIEAKSMQQLRTIIGSFDGLYCIGNTLAHAKNQTEIQDILAQVYEKLTTRGQFIAQVVNFDRVLATGTQPFSCIQKEEFTFERTYKIQGQSIAFTTTLTTTNGIAQQTTKLYPVTSSELVHALQHCGFSDVQIYGDYTEHLFSIQSPAIIVIARK